MIFWLVRREGLKGKDGGGGGRCVGTGASNGLAARQRAGCAAADIRLHMRIADVRSEARAQARPPLFQTAPV